MKLALLLAFLFALSTFADIPTEVPAGEIAGIVSDDAGRPLKDVLVDCWTWHNGNETKTDAAGHFHLKGLRKDGPIELRISRDGLSPWYEANQPTGVADLKVTLNDKTYLEGTVIAPDGHPLPNALVRADSGPKKNEQVLITHVWTEARADADGHYKLFVAPDNYVLEVRDPKVGVAHLRVTANADQAVTQDVRLEEGIRLVVNCVDDADQRPIVGVHVQVAHQKGMEATSDEKGQAILEHLPADKMELDFSSDTHMRWSMAESLRDYQRDIKTNESWSFSGADLDLSGGAIDPVTVRMEKGVTFSGRVLDPQEKPVAGAIVVTNRVGFADAIDQTQRFTAHTRADGSFTLITATCDDQVNLIAHDGDYGKWRHWANGVTDAMDATPGAKHDDLTIKLTVPATIKGQVVTRSGYPAPDKWVRVLTADDRDSRYTAPETHTDADGNFELKFVRPGDVLVQVEPFMMRQPNRNPPKIDSQSTTVAAEEIKFGVKVVTTR